MCAARTHLSPTLKTLNLHPSLSTSKILSLPIKSFAFPGKTRLLIEGEKFRVSKEGSVQQLDDDAPVSVELAPISSESQFDRVIAEAQQLEEYVIIVWMATWCRKWMYLKPKLEKLAADYYPRLQFYYVDINTVPHKLVARAGVTLWKDCKKQDELIGVHKAYLVVNEVRQMIENQSNL
ncbi:thioredoxin-like 3-2, chloroplastic isoform X2 [Mangifera indica]|uniref:thioredoxin-like 3-2, chloroplastic isoform X2 n=1 Tax=Mangifera indica TaxID=29780 RepID=UPI001CF9CCF4|nr:thioredoxin-like 3-2, chloroplastic isoform X2 [Mangifera indica]